jgi:hypothetical protein
VAVSTQRTQEHLIRTIIEMSTCNKNYSTIFVSHFDAKNSKGIHIGQIQTDFEAIARHVKTRSNPCGSLATEGQARRQTEFLLHLLAQL